MKLFEIQSTVDWEWLQYDPDRISVAGFFLDDDMEDEIEVSFQKDELFGREKTYQISFDRGGRMDETGEGKEMQIFSTVLEILFVFISIADPIVLYWSGDHSNPARIVLYNRFLKILKRKGWNVTTKPMHGSVVYIADREPEQHEVI